MNWHSLIYFDEFGSHIKLVNIENQVNAIDYQ